MARAKVMVAFMVASCRLSYSSKYLRRPNKDIQDAMVEGSMVKQKRTMTVFSETIPMVSWNKDMIEITISDSRDSINATINRNDAFLRPDSDMCDST